MNDSATDSIELGVKVVISFLRFPSFSFALPWLPCCAGATNFCNHNLWRRQSQIKYYHACRQTHSYFMHKNRLESAQTNTHTSAYAELYTHTYIPVHLYIHLYTYMCIHLRTHLFVAHLFPVLSSWINEFISTLLGSWTVHCIADCAGNI